MIKKYLNFKDYFIDRKQAKRFKKWDGIGQLFTREIVTLSNDNITKDLTLNIDKYINTTIIFQNSSFNNIIISENNNENNNIVIFKNCKIFSAIIKLGESSDINIENCKLSEKMSIDGAKNVCIKEIKSNDISNLKKIIANNIKNIDIEEVHGHISLIVHTHKININKCNMWLDVLRCDSVIINNSGLFINEINSKTQILVLTSKLRQQFTNNYSGLIKTSDISVAGLSEISNCYIQTENMNIIGESYLLIQNTCFDILYMLDIKKHSYVEDNQYKDSIIDVNVINVSPMSGLDIRGLEYSNISDECVNIELNELKNERKKLVKTLHLINDKYNPQLKDLE